MNQKQIFFHPDRTKYLKLCCSDLRMLSLPYHVHPQKAMHFSTSLLAMKLTKKVPTYLCLIQYYQKNVTWEKQQSEQLSSIPHNQTWKKSEDRLQIRNNPCFVHMHKNITHIYKVIWSNLKNMWTFSKFWLWNSKRYRNIFIFILSGWSQSLLP